MRLSLANGLGLTSQSGGGGGGPAPIGHADVLAALASGDAFYDSLLLSGQTIATDGTGPAPGPGDVVGTIADAVGTYPALAAPNTTVRPQVAADGVGHVYDGVSDELAFSFSGFTKPTNCDLIAVYDPVAKNHIIFDGVIDSDGGSFYAAVAQSPSTSTVLTSGSGTPSPTVHVTRAGVTTQVTTRGALYTAVTAGKCIVEVRGADLTSWSGFSVSGYLAASLGVEGTVYGTLILDAPDTTKRNTVRGLIGEYYGVET